MTRWLALAPLAVLAALALLFSLYALKHDPKVQPRALVGKALPDLVLPSLDDGRPITLRRLVTGESPVLVNVYASWCGPCALEAPQLMRLKQKGAVLIGIAYKDAPENTQAFLARVGDPYAQRLMDRDGRAGIELGVTGVPETYLVNAQGLILAKYPAPLSEADVRSLLVQLGR
ncbi:MAG: thiol:disulfide interchange protein [Phenylobacterium zucineum]|nr:MAG: thiol:disulfide interchange protein [Phenylobacterium zucineum]